MSALVDRIMERPTSQKAGMWIGSFVVIFFVFWQYLYSGSHEEVNTLDEAVRGLEMELVNQQRLARELPKVKETVKELDIKLKYALQELPDKKEIPDLLSSISNLAKDAGLDVSLFKPRGENFKDFYAEVPIAISVEGTFHQVATFFDEVGRLDRIVNISDISFKEPKVTPGATSINTKANCVATTFRYLDESERVKPTDNAQGGKRRGKRA